MPTSRGNNLPDARLWLRKAVSLCEGLYSSSTHFDGHRSAMSQDASHTVDLACIVTTEADGVETQGTLQRRSEAGLRPHLFRLDFI